MFFDRVQRILDEFGLVADRRRRSCPKEDVGMIVGHSRLDVVDDRDRVRTGLFRTPTETDGTPSSDAAELGSPPVFSTVPISLTLIGKPLRVVITMSLNCSTSVSLLIVRTPSVRRPSTMLPPGISWFCDRMAVGNLGHRHVERAKPVRIYVHPDLRRTRAPHEHLTDAVGRFDPFLYKVFDLLGQLHHVARSADRVHQDRLRIRIALLRRRRIGGLGQAVRYI